ncbi:MAG: hypothetical protein V7K67_26495 [Nostoc sp.]|uniref:hypothetical protein n=1 Tax=Nostoc sp. TaxID=1180 RepID=UPI002FFD0609
MDLQQFDIKPATKIINLRDVKKKIMKNTIIKLAVVITLVFSLIFSWEATPAFAFNFSSLNTLMATNGDQAVDNMASQQRKSLFKK